MALPDLSRLEARSDVVSGLGRALRRIGVSLAAASRVVAAASLVPPAQRRPIHAFYLRKMREPVGFAMRMFMFRDPVAEADAKAALGDLLGPLLEIGMLARGDDGLVVSPFILGVLDDLYVLSDDLAQGDEAVMGFGETTVQLCGAAFPEKPVGRALDLGCGSGTAALLLARRAREVVGTDINPRAVALARVNAALNDLSGIDLRVGDRFEPVRGEAFDLIVSQPPFIARPEGVAAATFLYGGRRGDEIAWSVLGSLLSHLTPGGRAVLHVDWPEPGDGALEQRIRAAIGPGADLLVLRAPPVDIDAHAVAYAAGLHPGLGPAFEAEVRVRREHFERENIREIVPTMLVVERTRGAPGFTAVVHTEQFGKVTFTGARIDKMLLARAVAANRDRLLRATLRVPEGTTLAQEQIGPGAEVPSTLAARFPPDALLLPMFMSLESLALVTSVHEAKTVREGLEGYAEVMGIPVAQAMNEGIRGVEEALLRGLLEVHAG